MRSVDEIDSTRSKLVAEDLEKRQEQVIVDYATEKEIEQNLRDKKYVAYNVRPLECGTRYFQDHQAWGSAWEWLECYMMPTGDQKFDLESAIKKLVDTTTITNIVTFGLGYGAGLTYINLCQHAVIGKIIDILQDPASYKVDKIRHEQRQIFENSFRVVCQNPYTRAEQGDGKTGWPPEDLVDNTAMLSERVRLFKHAVTWVRCHDPIGFNLIDSESLVVILDWKQPWRQLLGRSLGRSGKRPRAIICVAPDADYHVNTYDKDGKPIKVERDDSSKTLQSIVDEVIFKKITISRFAKSCSADGGKDGLWTNAFGPLNLYYREQH